MMTNKELKEFRNAIHKNLKISPQNEKSSCFIVREEKKESPIQRIEFTFKNQDDVLIIRQQENRDTINILEDFSTNCSCDFIIFMLDKKRDARVYFCEIKPSCRKIYLEEAYGQIYSSKLFLKYVVECYEYYTHKNFFMGFDVDAAITYYYIYPKINNANKKKTYISSPHQKILHLKPVDVKDGVVKIPETKIDEFFRI